jgi:putative oxidoreductase
LDDVVLDDFGLLAARSAVGLALAAHGAQKAFGWLDGPGSEGTARFMESLGFIPGDGFGKTASYTEIAAGTLMALGFLGALGPALLLSGQSVALASVHAKNGFFVSKGGYELNVMYIAAALALSVAGPGKLSLDEALGLQFLHKTRVRWPVLAGGLAGGLFMLTQRRPPKPTEEPARSSKGSHRESVGSPTPA